VLSLVLASVAPGAISSSRERSVPAPSPPDGSSGGVEETSSRVEGP
jgi:hypothetical protein